MSALRIPAEHEKKQKFPELLRHSGKKRNKIVRNVDGTPKIVYTTTGG